MNRLSVRLTLAFVGVTLAALLVVALLIDWNTDQQFRRYLAQVADNNAAQATAVAAGATPAPGMGGMMGRGQQGDMRDHMIPPEVLDIRERGFLDQLRNVLVIAALVAGGVGLALGTLISRALVAPLGALAAAARDFAAHRWDRRVPVSGTTEMAEVAQAFNAMADELQRAETLRRNLMADIAHELRTPLTVMQGNLRAMLDGVYPLEMKEVASLYDETRLLARLVSDVRELALADAGQLPLSNGAVDVLPLLRGAVETFGLAADAQGTMLELQAENMPPVWADADRLLQVIRNLLANALRHTPGGQVTLLADLEQGALRVTVRDSGEGIPTEKLAHVFDRFYRADPARERSSGSVGLGLAIAKAWVEAMGGQIGANSEVGKGSAFWFTLPLTTSASLKAAAATTATRTA
jgi:two-component system OmpR family sensor kinase/two-component system sensor histidine kinase BaeS